MTCQPSTSDCLATRARPEPPWLAALAALACAMLAGCASPPPAAPSAAADGRALASTARVNSTVTSRALQQLPPKPRGQRLAVAIHRFRSSVAEVPGASATDIFTAALVESQQFRVLERAQLRGGVIAEKQLNATGQTQGQTAQQALLDARYIFEGTVSEANTDEAVNQGGVSVGPVSAGGSSSRGSIAIDVRVVSVATGEVLDAITVKKPIYARTASAGVGAGNPLPSGGALATAGPSAAVDAPTARGQVVSAGVGYARKDGVGRALRACIEVAVLQLARRLDQIEAREAAMPAAAAGRHASNRDATAAGPAAEPVQERAP